MAGGINPFGFAVSAPPAPAPRAPIDLPSAPFGFAPPPSKWEQTAAILNEYNPIDAFWRLYNSDMAKGGAITDQNIEDGMMVGGTVMGGGAMIPKPANALNMGIRAYHGSPHSFDKFSMDKIGTGEGAQAYGHGLYFAEREGVAKSYRDALSPKNYLLNAPEPEIAQKYGQDVLDMFISHGGDPNELKDTISRLSDQNKRDLYDLGLSDVSQVKPQNDWGIEASLVTRADRLNRLQGLLASEDVKVDPGSMYEVDIDADPNAFLDWDKPLSEQPEAVQGFANSLKDKSFLARKRLQDASSATGRDVWEKARNAFGVGQADAATKALAEAGIPGIKYLDAGSRYTPANLPNNPIANEARQFLDAAQGDGEKALQLFRDSNPVDRWAGSERDEITKVIKSAAKPVTRNYVVFDDKLISIVKKYGIAGASAMLGYNLLESVNPAQADELKRIEAGK